MTITAQKAIPSDLRRLIQRVTERDNAIIPRKPTPEETRRYMLLRNPPTNAEAQQEQAEMRRKIAAANARFNKRINDLADRYGKRQITLADFRAAMLQEIHYNLITGAAIGAGGLRNLHPSDLARVDTRMNEEQRYLNRWIMQLDRMPKADKTPANIASRARQYGESIQIIAEETIDKNLFREFPSFPDAIRPKINTECHRHCHCTLDWVNVDRKKGNADIYYRLHPAEHCYTCLVRSMAFSPLMIRDWKFVNMPPDLSLYIWNGTSQHAVVPRLVA